MAKATSRFGSGVALNARCWGATAEDALLEGFPGGTSLTIVGKKILEFMDLSSDPTGLFLFLNEAPKISQ